MMSRGKFWKYLGAFYLPVFSFCLLDHALCAAEYELFSQHDFRSGEISNSGQNLYVSKDGALRLINSYDFNGDGYPDILVLNDHNHFETPPSILYRNDDGHFSSLLPPLREDMSLYETLERYSAERNRQVLLPTLGGVAATTGDFNGDGKLDIAISNFVHGSNLETFPLPIYWGGKAGYRPENRSLLNGFFCAGLTAADLNGDGIDDLVIACRGPEYEASAKQKLPLAQRTKEASEAASHSYAVLGSKNWSGKPSQVAFTTLYAIDVAATDLNGDGRPDLVFLEAGLPGQVRIFYSSKEGYAKEGDVIEAGDVQWDVIRSRKIRLADVNQDGAKDILVPTLEGLQIFWNDGKGHFSKDHTTFLDIKDSYAATVGDFNGDGKPDLAVAACGADAKNVILLNSGGPIETWPRQFLPSQCTNAVLALDLNHDGFEDLVAVNYLDPDAASLDTNSFIYWGGKDGLIAGDSTELATFGAVDAIGVPSDTGDKLQDLLFVNRQSGKRGLRLGDGPTAGGGMPSYVYWGNARGKYSPGDMTRIMASTSETPAVSTDLTGDGQPDLVLMTQDGYHASIYGLNGKEYTLVKDITLPSRGKVPLVADFDGDGTLDLLVTAQREPKAYLYRDVINAKEPETISLPAIAYSAALGDMDGDGHLDLVSVGVGNVSVLYGSSSGFDSKRSTLIKEPKFFAKVDLADLDNDGKLDVVAFAWNEIATGKNDTDSLIFWNKGGGIGEDAVSPLPTLGGAHQGSIADVNNDGNLDIVASNYHGDGTRHLDVQVFLGDGTRTFTRERCQTLPGFSSAANQVMDFNGDGYKDILVFNHSESSEKVDGRLWGGKHSTGSWIYWGSAKGFSEKNREWIPTYGPHNKLNVDPGDILHRQPWEYYTSPTVSLGEAKSGNLFLRVNADKALKENIQASVEVPGPKGEVWHPLPVASEGSGFLEFGPTKLEGAKSIRYRLAIGSGAPEIHSVKGILRD